MIGALFHGGIPDLRVGDLIMPGHARHEQDGCPFCQARAEGIDVGVDKQTGHPEHVYATTDRLYAKHYASLYGHGDLYRVLPAPGMVRSDEDFHETYRAPAFEIAAVIDRAVRLTDSERRRLMREWPQTGTGGDPMLDLALHQRNPDLHGLARQIYRGSEAALARARRTR